MERRRVNHHPRRPAGSTSSAAYAINNVGQVVGSSVFGGGEHGSAGTEYATEWSGESVIDLGGRQSFATGINDAGQVVGFATDYATEWSAGPGSGVLFGSANSIAYAINDAGQVAGGSGGVGLGGNLYAALWTGDLSGPLASAVPEPSTWAMMLLGFAGLGFVGYRTSRKAINSAD
jgi:uncharacterized membrane protein